MSLAPVPYFRPSITEHEISEVVAVLRSRWLTTGPKTAQFEAAFAQTVGADHAVAVNSCTAALHLAVAALGLGRDQAVLVPTMTFAATAEVVRYMGAVPVFVDCDAETLNLDLSDAERKIAACRRGALPGIPKGSEVVGIMPVNVGGLMVDVESLMQFARRHELWTVEDAAHSFPAAWRRRSEEPWQPCGADTADVTCFSFYANKTITTGEGGMAVTRSEELAQVMRRLSLHGLSRDAWSRYAVGGSWDYQIVAPGYKYNMTDVAAALGLCQLARAEAMRQMRKAIADDYRRALEDVAEIALPPDNSNRQHAWHLFPIRCDPGRLAIGRDAVVDALKQDGISCSVHWRPLHLHAYYRETFGWRPTHCPVASRVWGTLISLPIFPDMSQLELTRVVSAIRSIVVANRRRLSAVS